MASIPSVNVQETITPPATQTAEGTARAPADASALDVPGEAGLDPTESAVQPGLLVYEEEEELKGRLEISQRISARGGYSDVHQATWYKPDGTESVVCAKVLRNTPGKNTATKTRSRILREAIILKRTTHPNIVKFHGVSRKDQDMVIVTDWCSNGDLATYLDAHPKATLRDKLNWLEQLAKTLKYLHELPEYPIYHGDIKPENVLILDNGEAAWIDFGISRITHSLGWKTGLTTSNPARGTIGYRAPEQVLEEEQPTPASDVYAFGGLTLWLLSGKRPFEGIAEGRVFQAFFNKQLPNPTQHPALPADSHWWTFLNRCWSYNKAERPTIDEVIAEVQKRRDALSAN